MKNFIITTVIALLIGAFAFTANAQDRKVVRTMSKTEKQVKPENKRQNVQINNVNENSTKAPKDAKLTLELKKEAEARARAEAEKKAIKENNDLFDEFVKAVDNCEIHYKKPNEKNQFSQCLEEAMRLNTKINTKMLTDEQKVTFEEYKVKLNGFLKG